MDTKTIIKEAKARFDHNSAKQLLKEKYQTKLTVASQGGLWKVTPELLMFLDNMGSNEIILIDSFDNLIKVNRQDLFYSLRDTYNEVMEQWHNEFQELRKNR